MSRRRLFLDLGAAGVGVALVAACSSDDSSSGDATSASESSGSDAPAAESAAPDTAAPDRVSSDSVPPGESAPGTEPDDAGSDELRFQHVSLGFVSAFVLARGSEAAIVDTGSSGSTADILEGLAALSLGPDAVRHVILTHDHGDHIGGLPELEAELAGATVHAGPGDIDSVATSLTLSEVADGDEVFGLGVIATPGHTPGSISLFDTATGLLVAGDAINGDGSGGLTGANPDFTPDLQSAAESVARLAALEPSIAAFGHGGPPVTDDVAAKLAALVGP